MAIDPRLLERETLTDAHSQTEPAPQTHPAKTFLRELGIDTEHFPTVRFIIEVSEKSLRVGRLIIPLRLPNAPGYVYETVARITRVLEIPAIAQKGHRKFLEVEWLIAEEATVDEPGHQALSFLAAQVECASCHEVFVPEPEILSETSIRLACPNCLNYWSVSVSASQKKNSQAELLFDIFSKDSAKLRSLVKRWIDGPVASHDKVYFQTFPFHFEAWSEGTSLDWLFGEARGWTALAHGQNKDFESLVRGFLNHLALDHFRNTKASAVSELDQTEIQRKSEFNRKTDVSHSVIEHKIEIPPAEFPATPSTAEEKFAWAPPTPVAIEPTRRVRETERARAAHETHFFSAWKLSLVGIVGASLVGIWLANRPSTRDVEPTLALQPTIVPEVSVPPVVETPSPSPAPAPAPAPTPTPATPKIDVTVRPVERKPPTPKAETRVEAKAENKELSEQRRLRQLAVDASFRQGMLHLKLQQSRDAIAEFRKVITLDPRHADSYRGLGLAEVYNQNFSEAIEALSQYLELSPSASDRDSVQDLIATLQDRVKP